MAKAGGCRAEDIQVGEIRKAPDGLYFGWARCPAKIATKAEEGSVRVGWLRAKISLLSKRPLQCHRCLEIGHTRQRCTGPDRSDYCYRCGGQGHLAAKCTGTPSCVLCRARGTPSVHRMGGPACPSTKPPGKKGGAKSGGAQQQRSTPKEKKVAPSSSKTKEARQFPPTKGGSKKASKVKGKGLQGRKDGEVPPPPAQPKERLPKARSGTSCREEAMDTSL